MNISAAQVSRYVHLSFSIDTNRINAKGKDPAMNQLGKWFEGGVIQIELAQTAYEECCVGAPNWGLHAPVTDSERRAHKASSYVIALTDSSSSTGLNQVPQPIRSGIENQNKEIAERVELILFPGGARTLNQKNDVRIVTCAAYYDTRLITNDGDSKSQPGGILGNRDKLKELRIFVMTADEAVKLVEEKIRHRDDMARLASKTCGLPLPDWVGRD